MPLTKRVTLIRNVDSSLDGLTLDEAVTQLTEFKADYRLNGHTNIKLGREQAQYEDGWELNIVGERPEHETETNARLKEAAKQERYDRARLAELKKRYPD
ncbi:MAG: hypothetical protein EOQ39_18575 [Mesorhizobium sp.]|uniref:hypothetical protein n=1 Tax=Mesorhizobium sp. TaxID=1871066 RepID=UPI000FEA2CEA|nr:hypothetical protein [Mesorhizobium sp.]RWB08824.1 MAG: hypothetical protein EOQ37_04770 [Mesorhizobium sp.]RWB13526.1 MAG: hypothetical protein EOQ39_18575 [Mesorhizobium sp.]